MMSLKDYDPCAVCKSKKKYGYCGVKTKIKDCPSYALADWLKYELDPTHGDAVPIEFYAEVLRAKGWHGELKHTDVVKV